MDQETKITYSVIAVVIVLLLGLAYYIQPTPTEEQKTEAYATTTIKKQIIGEQPAPKTATTTATTTMDQEHFSTATITTSKGAIEIAFATNTPMTVKNFATLAKSDFYNGIRFHRVIKNFMIQTGDPFSKDKSKEPYWGTGGPGYKFNDELTGREQYPLGTVAMANSGPNTNGSQFFIVTANPGYPLPPNYTVFGHVTKGIDAALAIQDVQTGPSDRPVEDVFIEKVEVR
jgi:peptidylprolyl isomerase